MLVFSKFWSYAIITVIEILKIATVFIAIVYAANVRTEFVIVKRYIEGKDIPRWLYGVMNWGYYNGSLSSTADYREKERVASGLGEKHRYDDLVQSALIMFGSLAIYAALQFGLSRANAYSAGKLCIVIVSTLVFGLFICLDEKTPNWHTVVMIVALIIGAALMIVWIGVSDVTPTYGTPDNVWDFREEEIISEDAQWFKPTRLGLYAAQNGKVNIVIDGETFTPEETKDFAIKLIRDPAVDKSDGACLIRRESNVYDRNYTCRLPVVWTMAKSHQVIYELHYADLSAFMGGIRLNDEVILPYGVIGPNTT